MGSVISGKIGKKYPIELYTQKGRRWEMKKASLKKCTGEKKGAKRCKKRQSKKTIKKEIRKRNNE